ncbi:MAG TPA: protocatechuate 3,4-dioxygenase subunit alpha [Kineosporiaceae bacterium]|nr:protocatechuate 3,4-dioxygenase subunit alpha [Kineosporiaceae bacterium]
MSSNLAVTPGQTVGPFFGYALPYPGGNLLVPQHHPDAVRLHGTVLDGDGQPVPDALLEIWQADGDGRPAQRPGSLHRDGYTFTGWGRSETDRVGHYHFSTLEPGRDDQGAAPFIALTVFARGLMHRLHTRIYLPGAAGLDDDPFLRSVPEDRRTTLIAHRDAAASLRFDVHLQGQQETVFLSFASTASTAPTWR